MSETCNGYVLVTRSAAAEQAAIAVWGDIGEGWTDANGLRAFGFVALPELNPNAYAIIEGAFTNVHADAKLYRCGDYPEVNGVPGWIADSGWNGPDVEKELPCGCAHGTV